MMKECLKRCGFQRFRWFRCWYGGVWTLTCDFHRFIVEQNRRPCRYPTMYMAEGFKWVLAVEDYRQEAV